ncbi:ABC transporter substrate-binding protein [Roseomonas elaeocarpi]|uniref:ABC transporter substrate-binding protein n=1 Tax=Roseomonas elaeocarpi TaxID=907779 RepID=A0ABV6JN79_9PROT
MPQIAATAPHLRIGFLPLIDAAPIVLAERLGFFAKQGLRVTLVPTGAWAALRDRLLFGALDASHLLYPMPVAAAVGLGQQPRGLVAACGLGRNGNTLTLSHAAAEELGLSQPPLSAVAFAELARRRIAAERKLRLAIVHAYSTHGYLLRDWLAGAGLDPDSDVALEVVPPPLVGHKLAAGHIDGFCAGEPWGSQAVLAGHGRIALGTGSIWPDHSEKLLAFTSETVTRDPGPAVAATAAVIEAAQWLDDPQNRSEATSAMAEVFPDLDPRAVGAAFAGRVPLPGGGWHSLPHPLRFAAATRPDPAQAEAWLERMRRWGHLPAEASDVAALSPFRNDIWNRAAARLGTPIPHVNSLPEA